jgi:aspartate/methionine/tyrosine aminotransferase
MAIPIATRIEGVGTSVFSEMSALAEKYHAVNLGQGFPDFAGPAFIKEAGQRAIGEDLNQYAPSSGLTRFKDAAAQSYQRHYGRQLDPAREVTVTSGATEALFVSLLAFVNPGDEVIVLEPFYDSYPPAIRMAGGTPVFVRIREPQWRLPVEDIARAITPRTRVLMLNTPLNPVGRVFTREELQGLADLVEKHGLLVISDEVYERLVFQGHTHVTFSSLAGMWDRTITVSSTGKTFSMTGWKVGYIVAPWLLTDALRRVHQFCTFATATPLQAAMAAGLLAGNEYEAQFIREYEVRRTALIDMLADAGFVPGLCEGTYFVLAAYGALSSLSDVEFCHWMVREIGVAAIPPSAFYHDQHQTGMVRFCFAKRPETLAAAAGCLQKLRR